jgi:hypothetical protein
MSLLAPTWLVNQIWIISYILSAVVLVIFSDAINKYVVFPVADFVRDNTHKKIFKSKHNYKKKLSKIISESLATVIFIIYCYIGSTFLAKHLFHPVLRSFRNVLVLVLIIIFMGISFVINNKTIRNKFMQY